MKHQIKKTEQGFYKCDVCTWSWKYQPGDDCPGCPRYGYEQVPGHLLTFTQLKAKGLRPPDRAKPDGCYLKVRDKDWLWFYDERQALPRRRETEAQKAAREKAWSTTQEKYKCTDCGKAPQNLADVKRFNPGGPCDRCKEHNAYIAEQEALETQIKEDEQLVVAWAADMMQRDDWCLLDLETTSLTGSIVEVAIIDRHGSTLFHSLVNPQRPITIEAQLVHGLTDADVAGAPILPQIWPDLMKALEGRAIIVTFNTEFDKGILDGDAARYELVRSKHTWHCLMRKYAKYCGDWSEYWHDYRWYPLPGGNHRALGDALAALELMRHMASHAERLRACPGRLPEPIERRVRERGEHYDKINEKRGVKGIKLSRKGWDANGTVSFGPHR